MDLGTRDQRLNANAEKCSEQAAEAEYANFPAKTTAETNIRAIIGRWVTADVGGDWQIR
jgi:hypothetical protein